MTRGRFVYFRGDRRGPGHPNLVASESGAFTEAVEDMERTPATGPSAGALGHG